MNNAQIQPASPFRGRVLAMAGGIAFTFLIALAGYGMASLPGLGVLGQLGWAILIAALLRHQFGYPEPLKSGIQFTAKKLLRLAIILYGLKLNLFTVFEQGLGLLARDVLVVIFAVAVMAALAKWLKADRSLSLLLGIGTGICGAAAIAAVSPILKTKDEDTSLAVGMIALTGTIFALVYTFLQPFLPLSSEEYGIWSGISLHELAHVALAAAPAGEDALAISLLAKLGRVFLLIPFSFILLFWMRRKGREEAGSKLEFPWFLLGFMALSAAASVNISGAPLLPEQFISAAAQGASFLLAMAMVGLGLNIDFRTLRRSWRPLAAMAITSLLLSLLAFWII